MQGCKSRGIKLCGALVAAGLIAADSSIRRLDNQRKKYGVVTLTDCRSILDPALSNHHFGKTPITSQSISTNLVCIYTLPIPHSNCKSSQQFDGLVALSHLHLDKNSFIIFFASESII